MNWPEEESAKKVDKIYLRFIIEKLEGARAVSE
jgi:hypothetical protein